MNRIATIVHYLIHHPDDLLGIFNGNLCLLHVDEVELKAIKDSILQHWEF
jgi:hypothetical protein